MYVAGGVFWSQAKLNSRRATATAFVLSWETLKSRIQSSLSVTRVFFLSFTETLNRRTGALWAATCTTSESSWRSLVSCSKSEGCSSALNKIVSLSSHSKCCAGRSKSLAGQGSPPGMLRSQICIGAMSGLGFGSGRLFRNAMVSPEGDQRGCETVFAPRVSSTSFFSVRLERYRLLTRSSFSLSAVLFTQTAHLLSGEIRNSEASSWKTTSSALHGYFGEASGACEAWGFAVCWPGRPSATDRTINARKASLMLLVPIDPPGSLLFSDFVCWRSPRGVRKHTRFGMPTHPFLESDESLAAKTTLLKLFEYLTRGIQFNSDPDACSDLAVREHTCNLSQPFPG